MAWVSPTGFVDPDSEWTTEPYAYDEDTDTCAESEVTPNSWSKFLELTHAELTADKVRFWADTYYGVFNSIDLDVYYSGAWHDVYEGSFANKEWVEKTFSQVAITAARVRFYGSFSSGTRTPKLFEFDFNEVEVVAAGRSFGFIIG